MPDRLENQRRRKGPDCLSDFQIDCLVVGGGANGSIEESGRWRSHIGSCGLCSEKLARSNARRDRFAQEHPLAAISASTLAKVEEKTQRPFWSLPKWVGIVSGAGAAAVVLLIALSPPLEEDSGAGRLKGDASFGVYVKRGEAVFMGDSGGVYFPGDRLQFYHSNTEPRHLAILDLESTGRVSVFVPAHGDQPILVPKAREKILPGSIELDDSEGQEQLLALFCAAPFDLGAVAEQLERRGLSASASHDSSELGLGPQCSITRFLLNKIRPRE